MQLSTCGIILLAIAVAGCASHHALPTAEYHNPYHRPLNSPGGKFSGLPPAVQNTIRAQAGAEDIADILKYNTPQGVVYGVYFVNTDLWPPLLIARDGSVLNPDLTVAVGASEEKIGVLSGGTASGLKASDLPQNVMKVIQERAPNTEIALIHKEIWDGREVYVISFKDPAQNPKLYIAADGTVLKEAPK